MAAGPAKRLFSLAFTQVRAYSAPAERAIPTSKQKYVPTEGTYPKGFIVGTSHAGVKASNKHHDDITLIASTSKCAAAAVFTRNIFKAAPVVESMETLKSRNGEDIRGVVINSGCANAVTGLSGLKDARDMALEADKYLLASESVEAAKVPQTLVMSTGVIGQRLPMDRILPAIPKAHASIGDTHEHWLKAANAIMTTDTFPKLSSRTFTLPSHPQTVYSIAGMTKGAGMIHPNMGTLLGVICTDVKIEAGALKRTLEKQTRYTFNCISIDGDTSTNDTVAILANGAAAPPEISPMEDNAESTEDLNAFAAVLRDFMTDLAKLVVRDGEGATKFITIRVRSDRGYYTAKRAAGSIATSSLFKTAMYGKDANWGRILCAIGYAPMIMYVPEVSSQPKKPNNLASPYQVVPSRTSVSFIPSDGSEELRLLVRGEPEQVDEARAKQILEMEDLEILVRLEDGPPAERKERVADQAADASTEEPKQREVQECVFWTCDFSHEYVTINGDYRT